MRIDAGWRLIVAVLVCQGCGLETSVIGGDDVDGGLDSAVSDTSVIDAPAADAPANDSSVTPDSGPSDSGPSDSGPSDTSVAPDTAAPCTTHAISACGASHSDIEGCERLYDGRELAPACPTLTRVSLNCRTGTASYCDTSDACMDSDGCVEEFWIRFDLGAAMPVDQARFIAGWWADRPDLFEIWYSNSESDVPDAGATMAYSGAAARHPWACVASEACSAEVPDGCCPDGRSSPQVTDQSAYTPSCDLGEHFPKFDIAEFPRAVGRYWYLMVRSGVFDDRIWLYELELRNGAMCDRDMG